jgi:hypothetical protein
MTCPSARMELIVLNIGLDLGVISPTLFAMMVVRDLVTTFMTTPVLQASPGARAAREPVVTVGRRRCAHSTAANPSQAVVAAVAEVEGARDEDGVEAAPDGGALQPDESDLGHRDRRVDVRRADEDVEDVGHRMLPADDSATSSCGRAWPRERRGRSTWAEQSTLGRTHRHPYKTGCGHRGRRESQGT